jgi:hypothetical protein
MMKLVMTCNGDLCGIRLQSIVELTHHPHGTRTCDLLIRGPSSQYLHDKYFMNTKSEPKNFKNNKFVYVSRDKLRSGLHESFGKQKSFSILRGCLFMLYAFCTGFTSVYWLY